VDNEISDRKIIINADDFGYSEGVNDGIFDALKTGLVKSTSVMVNREAASEVVSLLDRGDVSIGLHLDMTHEGPRALKDWLYLFAAHPSEIERVFTEQVKQFEKLTGRIPDHIDGHHHIHMHPRVRPFVEAFAKKYGVKVRSLSAAKFLMNFHARGITSALAAEKVSVPGLIKLLNGLSPGVYEIMCHPGYVDQKLIDSGTSYLKQRELERLTLTSPQFKEYIQNENGLCVINWKDIPELSG
jgi:predicted glycoside hydrolase/deacetylase ChbG (UPF0249 family)